MTTDYSTYDEDYTLTRLFVAVDAIAEAVTAAGPAGIPSGHLYAMLMSYGMTLPVYQMLLDALTRNNVITVKHNVIRRA